jgi:hypothetical protein
MQTQNTIRVRETTFTNPSSRSGALSHGTMAGGSDIFGLMRLVVLFTVPLLIVNGAFPQLQMALLRGRVLVSPAVVKATVLAILIAVVMFRSGRIKQNRRLIMVTMMFFGYLLLNVLHFKFDLGMHLSDAIVGYNFYYTLPLLAVLSAFVPLRIPDRYILGLITILATICALLGIAQLITNRPIVATSSANHQAFQVLVWKDAGRVRVFSLFGEPQHCGLFFVFITTLLIALCRNPKHRFLAIPLTVVTVGLVLASDARTQIMGLAWAIAAALLLTFWNKKRRVRWLPLLAMPTAILAVVYAVYFGSTRHAASISRSTSMLERIREWTYYIGVLRELGLAKLLFGMGIVQNGAMQSFGAALPIDNIYLSIGMHIGLVGLVLYLLLAWMLWEEVSRRAEDRASYLHVAIAATFSTFFLMGLFNNVPTQLAAYFVLFAMSRSYEPLEQEASNSVAKQPRRMPAMHLAGQRK